MQVRLERESRTVFLTGKPLGHGGEAVIHPVPFQRGLPALVAKVYHRPTADHAAKLAAMIAHPPVDPMADHGHASITWPLDRLLLPSGTGNVVGYVMPRIDKALPMMEFFNPKARLSHCPLFHFGYLLRTAHNLAAAVRAIHEAGYVVGDLNESNCLVNNQALVTLVDTDSFQVPTPGHIFRCPVGKPEYTAPEMQGVNFGDRDRAAEHDNFALAVLIFQLLMQGIHPFAGKFTGAGEPAGLPERITAGHWPYAPAGRVPYGPNPHAPPLEVLPTPVRALMHLCFADGHAQPKRRPGANAWQEALRDGEKDVVSCPANDQHLFPKPLGRCPWCELARRQGRDLFPSQKDVQAGRFGVRRIVARLRKSLPATSQRSIIPSLAPAAAPVPAASAAPVMTLSVASSAGALGPLQPPVSVVPARAFAATVLFAAGVAGMCAAVSAVVVAICTAPPWVAAVTAHHKPLPLSAFPVVELLFGGVIGFICVYVIGQLFQPADLAAQAHATANLATIAAVSGSLAGGLGGWWGYVAALSNPVVLAGALGKQLGVIGLAFVVGGLGGLVGALSVGTFTGLIVALSRWASR